MEVACQPLPPLYVAEVKAADTTWTQNRTGTSASARSPPRTDGRRASARRRPERVTRWRADRLAIASSLQRFHIFLPGAKSTSPIGCLRSLTGLFGPFDRR